MYPSIDTTNYKLKMIFNIDMHMNMKIAFVATHFSNVCMCVMLDVCMFFPLW